jgi:hypothetical protein
MTGSTLDQVGASSRFDVREASLDSHDREDLATEDTEITETHRDAESFSSIAQ